MENVNSLICYLIAIQNFAKDIHYTCRGESFYAKHLLADRIQDGLYDYIDALKEVCFLGNNLLPLSSAEYLKNAVSIIPDLVQNDDKSNFESLRILLEDFLVLAQDMLKQDTPRGEVSLVDNIAQDIQQRLGLVNMQVKE